MRVRSISAHELREAFLVRAELEALATEVATPKMTPDDLAELDAMERRFGELTLELRHRQGAGAADATLFVERDAGELRIPRRHLPRQRVPLVERIAKGSGRTAIGDRVWQARVDEPTRRTTLQHRLSARRSRRAARLSRGRAAREHVLSNRLIEVALETLERVGARAAWWGAQVEAAGRLQYLHGRCSPCRRPGHACA